MRQIILDTETTGMDHREGHRIIEIGCVEMIERRLTGRNYHVYINPERAVDAGALEVHGITDEFLSDKPKFAAVAADFVDFVRDSEIIIHNATFDVGFLNAELARLEGDLNLELESIAEVLDTLLMARELHPGQRVNLDALCKRYDVDHSNRDLHGALLDAELLAEVYLAMTGGQVDLALDMSGDRNGDDGPEVVTGLDLSRLVAVKASAEERAAHEQRLDAIEAQSGSCLWRTLEV